MPRYWDLGSQDERWHARRRVRINNFLATYAMYRGLRSRKMSNEEMIRAFYRALWEAWGAQHWWPARTRFEVIVGAYLTQNTAWTNVERALQRLRAAGILSVAGIRRTSLSELEPMIRPAGYFRQKAARLKRFIAYLDQRHQGSLKRMFALPTHVLRTELLQLNGVGPETADSILLYAGNHPVFVVDAYTRRILERHCILPGSAPYDEIRTLFERALEDEPHASAVATGGRLRSPQSAAARRKGAAHEPSPMSTQERAMRVQVFNEMHGLIVGVGKDYCLKAQPHCEGCPLERFLYGTAKPEKH
jgi:endonuclease-3 related protein